MTYRLLVVGLVGWALACARKGDPGRAPAAPPSVAEAVVAVASAQFRIKPIAHPDKRAGQADPAPFEVLRPGVASRFDAAGERLSPVFGGTAKGAALAFPRTANQAFRLAEPTGLAIEVTMRGALPAAANLGGGYIVYRGAHPGGGDVLHRPTPHGTEDFVVLRDPDASVVSYDVALGPQVAGLRLVNESLEFLDRKGAPRLRVDPPYAVDARGVRSDLALSVTGCAVDRSPAAPWGRPVTAPGATRCTVTVRVPPEGLQFPVLLDPGWSTTASLPISGNRIGLMAHVTVQIGPTRVLVAGGASNASCSSARAYLFDYADATPTWAVTGSMAMTRYDPVGALVGNKVLVAGGSPGNPGGQSTTTAELYTISGPGAGTWAFTTGAMTTGRSAAVAQLFDDGKVLIAGGMNLDSMGNPTILASVELYDPTAGTFATNGAWDMSTPRFSHAISRLDATHALVTGGAFGIGPNAFQTAEVFDENAHTWTATTPTAAEHRDHAQVTLGNGKVLVIGGRDSTLASSNIVELYDPATGVGGTWTTQAPLATARHFPGAALLADGTVLAVGGNGNGTPLGSAEIFDPTAGAIGAWTSGGALSVPRIQYFTVTSLAGGAYALVVGGDDGVVGPNPSVDVYSALADANGTACSNGTTCNSGLCVDGVCCNNACGGGTSDCQACSVAAGGAVDGTCTPRTQGIVCRASTGFCDLADRCDGTSTVCPADARSSGVCRPAVGPCDVTEVCDGVSNLCPDDRLSPAGTVCRAAAGTCDVAEVCSGTAATCPGDAFQPVGTICRPPAGACDSPEACTGAAACPPDARSVAVCRAAVGPCDVAESCDGTANDCPADLIAPAGTTCRPAAGACDVAEVCNGSATTCPADVLVATGTICRAAAGPCDLPEACSGSAACPPDAKSVAVCRPAAHPCEQAISCDGLSNACGAPQPLAAGALCSDDGATCDANQGCTRTCPLVVGQPATQTCTHDGVTITVAGGTKGAMSGGGVPTITVTETAAVPPFSDLVPPSSYASPLYQLSPSGATFDPPLSISFTYRADGTRTPVVYLCGDDVTQCSVLTGTLGTNAQGEPTITVAIAHFSTAFVALVSPTDGGVGVADSGVDAGADAAADAAVTSDAASPDGPTASADAGDLRDTAAAPDVGLDGARATADVSVVASDAGAPASSSSGCSCHLQRSPADGGLGASLFLAGVLGWLTRRRFRRHP